MANCGDRHFVSVLNSRWLTAPACLGIVLALGSPARAQSLRDALADLATQVVGRAQVFTDGPYPDSQWRRKGVFVSGPSCTFVVDAATGIPIWYNARDAASLPAVDQFTQDQAQTTAAAFVARAGVSLDAWTLHRVRRLDRGSAGRTYEFQWGKLWQGIWLPSLIEIEVSEQTTAILNYMLLDDSVGFNIPQPVVTGDQAVRIMVQYMGFQQPVVESLDLDAWDQQLKWQVSIRDLQPLPGHVDLVDGKVDAVTGKMLGAAVPGSAPDPSAGTPHHPGKLARKPTVKFAKGVRIPDPAIRKLSADPIPISAFQAAEHDARSAGIIAKLRAAHLGSP